MRNWMVLTAGMLAMVLAGCSKAIPAADANQSAAQAPAVPPKPYIEPNAIFTEIAGEFEPVREKLDETATVDWSRGVITAVGSAKAPSAAPQERIKAQRGAEAVAVRNAVLAAGGILVDGRGRYANLRDASLQFTGDVPAHEVVSKDWDAATLTASATVCVPMYAPSMGGYLMGAGPGPVLLSEVRPWPQDGDLQVHEADLRAGLKAPPRRAWNLQPAMKDEADLIMVDARGSGLRPCLLPRILDEQGRRLFDPTRDMWPEASSVAHSAVYIHAKSGTTTAPVASTASAPGTRSVAGTLNRRIVLRARVAAGQTAPGPIFDVILPEAEITKLEAHGDVVSLLKAGRLVIIVDAP